MVEILKTLRDTPLPSILVIGGLVFLILPFLKKTGGAVEIETSNKGVAALIGVTLLISGIGLYLFPTSATNTIASVTATATQTQSFDLQPTATRFASPTGITVVSPTINASPSQVLQTVSSRQQYCYGQCWQYDHNARIMTWTGSTDGIEDIWQPSGEPLQRIREGYVAIFTTSVPGEIYACVLVVNGQSVKNACDGILYPVQPGTYRITSSNSQVGGFRWCPLVGYGWRVDGGECK